jgi:PAS domain S-box-containing protein
VVGAAVQLRAPAAGGGRGRVVGILVAAYGLETIQRFVDDFAAAQGVRLTVTDQRGVVVAAAGAARRGLDWTVTADVATGTAFAPIGELRRTVLTIGAVLGLALLAGLVLLARALGQRALAEQQVEEGEERTRELLAATAEAFISMDAAGLVTGWNARAEQTFGWPAAEAVGRPLAELIVPGRSRQAHDQGRRRYLETGDGPLLNRRVEVTALHRDGHQFPVEVVIWAVGSGPATTFNAFAHDITDRRQAEQVLKQAKQEAERANRAKSEFLSKMSHELRTPLNAILGFGQLLQLEDLTSEQAESVDHMLNGGRHLLGLIDEVLDISRIETDSLSLSPEPVDVMKVVKDTVDLIGPLAAERQIAVEAPDPDGGGWTVRADPQRLKQVLLNLVSNAVKYNRHGGSIRVTCQAASPGRVAVAVEDSGPGIPPDKMVRLFTPFDRLGAEQSAVQGTGMGLALSRGLVEAMGGSLTAESVEGHGTTFTLELAQTAGPAGPHDRALDPPPPGPGQRHTVLYVEDSPSNRRLVERVLHERGGVRLLTTGRGEEVQELVRRHRPELVLLDLQLPDLDGEEVLGRLKADPATARVPVVVVSVDVSSQKIERALAAGAREYLAKPLDVARFRTVVDSLLSKAPSRR